MLISNGYCTFTRQMQLFLFKSREIKIGSSVGTVVGELWLAEGSIQQRRAVQPCKFFPLAHIAKLSSRFLENAHKGKDPLFDS